MVRQSVIKVSWRKNKGPRAEISSEAARILTDYAKTNLAAPNYRVMVNLASPNEPYIKLTSHTVMEPQGIEWIQRSVRVEKAVWQAFSIWCLNQGSNPCEELRGYARFRVAESLEIAPARRRPAYLG